MPSSKFGAHIPADWARPLTDPQAFAREQNKLAHVWTFLGFERDVARDGDWFRTTLAARSVFVQRFGSELKGFENRCMHRFYPLRTSDKGNGPIICGFHHWRYNEEGQAIGIPMCADVFEMTPREVNARLNRIEIATCGSLIFGRFPESRTTETLEQFLGEGFPIFAAMSRMSGAPQSIIREVEANWRTCFQTSIDDYHIVAVHPATLGKDGYLKRKEIGYFRFGVHNAHFDATDPRALSAMAESCRNGTWRPSDYRIFHVFPSLAVSIFCAYAQYWYIHLLQFSPISPNRSLMRAWIYPSPFPVAHARHVKWTWPFTHPWRERAVRYYLNRVLREDTDVCEQLQTVAHQVQEPPLIGALEQRIGWFEESYARAMSAGDGEGADAGL